MSKDAYVLRGYVHGSERTVDDQVIEGMEDGQFGAFKANGLVREATAAEVKAAKERTTKEAKTSKNKVAPTPANKGE